MGGARVSGGGMVGVGATILSQLWYASRPVFQSRDLEHKRQSCPEPRRDHGHFQTKGIVVVILLIVAAWCLTVRESECERLNAQIPKPLNP